MSRVTRVQSDSHGHTLVTIMNSPHVVLFSNAHQIIFWKDQRIMVYSRIEREKLKQKPEDTVSMQFPWKTN